MTLHIRYGNLEETYLTGRTVHKLARELANDIIEEVHSVPGPVVWLTGSSYLPPLRSFTTAERVWDADNNRDGELWAWFVEMVEDHLSAANIALECPDYDNALYAVDLKRWQYKEPTFTTPGFPSVPDDLPDDLNDEWEPVDPDAVDDNAENPRE